jgi:hypothetical protein
MKMERVARKLAVGFESFKIINQPKTDVNLRFSNVNMQRMATLLDASEQDEFLLVWRPQVRRRSISAGTAAGAAPRFGLSSNKDASPTPSCLDEGIIRAGMDCSTDLAPSACSSDAELLSSDSEFDAGSIGSSVPSLRHCGAKQHGAKLSPEQQEEVRKMRAIPIEWRAFHINLGAFLYCTQFKMPVPPAVMPITRPEVSRWLGIKQQDQVIHHHFTLYK